jgi:N-carbamoylsarcosine amidase
MAADEITEALHRIFNADSELYKARGFMRRVGFGKRPAVVNIDLANAWTRPGSPFSCDHMDTVIPSVQRLIETAREHGVPVIYVTTAYQVVDGPATDTGTWARKVPIETLAVGSPEVEIDSRIEPRPDELLITKKRASAFHGTNLTSVLVGAGVDTVIATGVTMAGCVRHTVEDASAEGFRVIVPRECVADRVAGVVEWNLFDLDAKFADVESLDTVLGELEKLPAADEARAAA